ncbi:ImmA/IrrE family metallo-endopeptidase [Pseudomonas sp. MHK4]
MNHKDDEQEAFVVIQENIVSPRELINALKAHDEIIGLVKASTTKQKSPNSENIGLFRDMLTSDGNSTFFRQAANANTANTAYWLSRIKNSAQLLLNLRTTPDYQPISVEQIHQITRLSPNPNNIQTISNELFKLGIILIFDEQLKGMKLDGAVFKIKSGHPVIGMTLRHSRLDNFWFTLTHELCHIHLHLDQLDTPILDDLEAPPTEDIELEADRLTKSIFVSRNEWRNCEPKYDLRKNTVIKYANEKGLHPAIIAGMLRHELGRYEIFSDIVSEYNTRDLIFKS